MVRRVAFLAVMVGMALALAGCALNLFGGPERRAAWRDDEERACMKSGVVQASAYVRPARAINDRGACGIARPLKVSAAEGGRVTIAPTATLGCPMTAAVDQWMNRSVQPAAIAWFGVPVAEIHQISAYACRPRNNIAGEQLSEHAFGNALDVAGFTLANGRKVTVKGDWAGRDIYAKSFLREVFAAACQQFKTVLGPGVEYHGDHFHLDLAHHGRDGAMHYCKPTPDGLPPMRPPYDGGMVARNGGGLLDWIPTGSIPSATTAYGDE
jgi:hypothetical protein